MLVSPSVHTHESAGLVAVSVLVAVLAAYLALDLVGRSTGSEGWARRAWVTGGGVILGLGIWSMHFVGMLALKMGMPVSYDLPLVALSMFAAVFGSTVALGYVARSGTSTRQVLLAAGFMSFAIAAMHYLGMASMQMEASIDWSTPLIAASLVVAYGASALALYVVRQIGRSRLRMGVAKRLSAAGILGLGIAGLHYTAMAAATFRMTGTGTPSDGLDATGLVVLLGFGAALALAVLVGGAAGDRRRIAAADDLALVAGLSRRLAADPDARRSVCDAARQLTDADFVLMIESSPEGGPRLAGCAGLDSVLAHDVFLDDPQITAALVDASSCPRWHPAPGSSLDGLGVHLALAESLVADEEGGSVLVIAYRSAQRALDPNRATLLRMLAADAALIIDRQDLMVRLEFLAHRDELTGLANRRSLQDRLGSELESAAGHTGELTLAILDLDSFKEINDSRGHEAGDEVLRAVGKAWGSALDVTAMVGRYGGDEFLAILPDRPSAAAAADIGLLRSRIPAGITCSAGLATWDGEQTMAQLIAAADRNLYAAKEKGRNRAEVATPSD